MAGYSSTPLWKKLGYTHGLKAVVDGGPPDYAALLRMPSEVQVEWLRQAKPGVKFVHVFCHDATILKTKLTQLRKQLAPDGTVWVSWPKKSSGVQTTIAEDIVRASALPLGFVDIKVCAVDDVWSGLKLVIRKSQR